MGHFWPAVHSLLILSVTFKIGPQIWGHILNSEREHYFLFAIDMPVHKEKCHDYKHRMFLLFQSMHYFSAFKRWQLCDAGNEMRDKKCNAVVISASKYNGILGKFDSR